MVTAHIRQQLARRGGNSFYKDRSERKTATLCGAPVTDRDVDFRYGGTEVFGRWLRANPDSGHCAKCLELRKAVS